MEQPPIASEQQPYQVRFDWGVTGAQAVAADADVLVWIDALDPEPAPLTRLPAGPAVVESGLPDAVAVAAWILALQERRQQRTTVALIGAGRDSAAGLRFAVEDLLTAGAVVDALEARGIDAFSPEAAAADAAYRGLRGAIGHLFRSASGGAPVPDDAARIDPAHTPADVVVRRE